MAGKAPCSASPGRWSARRSLYGNLPFRRPPSRVGSHGWLEHVGIPDDSGFAYEQYSRMIDFDRLLTLFRALNREGVEYVVVDAVALGLHGLVRATEDVALFIRPTTDNIARLRRALSSVWPDPDIDAIVASDLAGEYPAIRYGPPDGSFTLDLLARLGERFEYDDLEASTVELEGEPVRAATPSALYVMKRDTVRPQDRADAAALRRTFDLEEE